MKLSNDPPRNRPAQPPNDTANNKKTQKRNIFNIIILCFTLDTYAFIFYRCQKFICTQQVEPSEDQVRSVKYACALYEVCVDQYRCRGIPMI